MKKPEKKYGQLDSGIQRVNSEADELFYMCEYIDAYVAKPRKEEEEVLETQIN